MRYEKQETGKALRRLLRIPQDRQPYIAIRTTVPNRITETIKVDPTNSSDKNGKIQLGCRSSMWNGICYWYWNDKGENTGDNEITYVEF